MKLIPWGEYRPDVADITGDNTRTIANVVPRGDGYGPVKSVEAYSQALGAVCRGAFRALNSDGSVSVFSGSAAGLFKMNNQDLSWSNVSKSDTNELSYSGSANIGNATGGGGLAAAFDGTTAQALAACATLAASTSIYVGKTLATAKAIRTVKVYGSNDQGYVNGANPSVTINLYGKIGTAPSSGTDGTLIGTTGAFTDTANESTAKTITATDQNTEWKHVWVNIVQGGAGATMTCAEIEIFANYTYLTPSDQNWGFQQYSSFVIAVQGGDVPQVYTLGSSSVFSDLGGSPPIAKYISIVNEFVVLTGLVSFPYRMQWSGRSAPTTWTSGVSESDYQDFPDGGPTGPMGGGEKTAIVLQTNAMRRMTYQPGSSVIFTFDRISDDIGILAPYSLVKAGPRLMFLSNAGFQQSVDGGVPVPVGKERIDNTFTADWDDNQMQLAIGFSDPSGTRMFFAYKSNDQEELIFDKILCFDWAINRWSPIIDITGEYVASLAQVGQTLDGLDSISMSLDALAVSSLDAFPVAFGKEIALFNTSHQMGFLTGPNLEAILESPEQGEATNQQFISGMRAVTDAYEAVYGQVSRRQHLGDVREWNMEAARDAAGLIPARVDTRHARYRNRIPAGTTWSYSSGIVPQSVVTGNR